jgi:hypothetical protein
VPKKDILIIGDAHAKPGVSNRRFYWAGRYAADEEPDIIVDMGDWEDMPSLCTYDYGKKAFENRRYLNDLQAAHSARAEFNRGLQTYNQEYAARHKAKYNPKKIALGGNHSEGRITKAIEVDPKLDGWMSIANLKHREFGWEYVPYLEPIELQGFTFSHYFASGIMGRPIGGEMPALAIIRKQLTSCVAGHSHLFDIAHRTRPDGSRVWGIVAGCFMDKEQWESYAAAANRLWWRGLILLRGCENGDFESFSTITVEELERLYGRENPILV